MGLNLVYLPGQTPIDENEKDGLRIETISLQSELDEFEQKNIEDALLWIKEKKWKMEKVFTETFVREVHRRMLKDVWKWAGEFRKTEKNIGVASYEIAVKLQYLLDDARFWTTHQTYTPDEIAIRLKHRLVAIHCFPNGNGRHSRLFADLLVEKLFGQPAFSWGARRRCPAAETRQQYISALRAADCHDIQPLLAFARS